jgi:hypothetical protein
MMSGANSFQTWLTRLVVLVDIDLTLFQQSMFFMTNVVVLGDVQGGAPQCFTDF